MTTSTASDQRPLLSVVLVTPTNLERLERTLLALQAQTICDRIEVILVAPSSEVANQDDRGLLEGFYDLKIVPIGTVDDVTACGANGVIHCQADVVGFVEDHAYPFPGWAESVTNTHQGPWAAVGSTYIIDNPQSYWAWCSQIISYGPYTAPVKGGEVAHLPAHNISYKKDLLLALGDQLEESLKGWERQLNIILQREGHRFYLDQNALIRHREVSNPWILLEVWFVAGRSYAGRRWQHEGWSLAWRLLYALGTPLVPFKRAFAFWQEAFQGKDRSDIMPLIWFTLIPVIVANALGQMVGFLGDDGDTDQYIAQHELRDRRTMS
jgi:hypothetical protein